MIGILFWSLTLAGCGYAAACGGKDGRWAAFLILSASILSIPATRWGTAWTSIDILLLGVDSALLAGLYLLALKSQRFFPIWMAGLHLIAVSTHLATLLTPSFTPHLYRAIESLWAVPVTLAMIAGVALDRRNGLTD